jgi:hypothetical protein
MLTLAELHRKGNLELAQWIISNVLATAASVDTVELFFPARLSRATRNAIEADIQAAHYPLELNPQETIRFERSFYNNTLQGWRLIINEPEPALLPFLDRYMKQYRAKLCRVDVALDWVTGSLEDMQALQALIARYLILRWRRKGPMGKIGDWAFTIYWDDPSRIKRKGYRKRNLVLYTSEDKPSKVYLDNVVHLELRFRGTQTCRRQGWDSPADLVALNPAALAARHLRLCFDIDGYLTRLIRKQVMLERNRRERVTSERPRREFNGARYADRIRQTWEDSGRLRSQWLKDDSPKAIRHTVSIEALNIPSQIGFLNLISRHETTPPLCNKRAVNPPTPKFPNDIKGDLPPLDLPEPVLV